MTNALMTFVLVFGGLWILVTLAAVVLGVVSAVQKVRMDRSIDDFCRRSRNDKD